MSAWISEKTAGSYMKYETVNNYYDLLALSPGATDSEIEDAYLQTKALYGQGSVATYSLYSDEEREKLLIDINEAYSILKDPLKRRDYDLKLSSQSSVVAAEHKVSALHLIEDKGIAEKNVTLKNALTVMDDKDPMAAEQFRILYTKLEHISHNYSYKSFAVTSALKGEGKSSTTFNIAYVMAHEFGKKVLILDCDLRKPSISSYLNEEPSYGLIDVVKGDAELGEAVVKLKGSSLYILTSGGHARNSSEVLSSGKMSRIINVLKEEFDYIIVDSPPIFSLADMNIISKMVDGILLVVRAGETPKDIVQKAAHSLPQEKIAGIILNGAEVISKKYKYYY